MTEHSQDELNFFKAQDPRPAILPALGWTHEPKDGDKDRWVRGGDSVSVFKGKSGQWMMRSGAGYRTIVHLATETAGNLGQARKFLRQLVGSPSQPSPSSPDSTSHFSSRPPVSPDPAHSSTDMSGDDLDEMTLDEIKALIAEESEEFSDKPVPGYLLERGFLKVDPLFRRAMRVAKDRFKNVIFLYYLPSDAGGVELVSRERKGPGYKNYLAKTKPGVWIAAPQGGQIDHIVVCEAPLDCISSRSICGDGDATAYLALRSGAEDACVELIRRMIETRGEGAHIEIRTDNDPAGLSYASKIAGGLKKQGLVSRYTAPPDWHDDWTAVQEARFRASQGATTAA